MPAKYSRHIALTGPLAEWVDRQVASGAYMSVSDLIRIAIRLLKEHDKPKRRRTARNLLPQTEDRG